MLDPKKHRNQPSAPGKMASFDDLAFIAPPSNSHGASTPAALFCRDCDEVVLRTTADGKRCLVCGCELERQHPDEGRENGAPPIGGGNVQDLRALVMRLLGDVGGDWLGGASESRRPAADDAVARLGSFVADQASTIEVAITVDGIKGEVIAIPGNFGPCESVKEQRIVLADPFNGAKPFANSSAMKDKIVVMERGACTFAQKVMRAEAAGAAAVIIIQTLDIWPYTMTDSTGEGSGISIPAFMMSAKHGKGFVAFLREKNAADTVADIVVRKNARECVICQVEMAIGMKVTRMPCQHLFHTECLHEWLKIGNSCPICRVEIPSKASAAAAGSRATALGAQQRGDFAWSDWFS